MASTSALPPNVPIGARVLSGGMANVPALKGANFWDPASGPKVEVVALVGTDKYTRYDVRQALQGSGLLVDSRGPQHQRVMLVWRETDVADTLAAALPRNVVQDAIMPRLKELLAADDAAAQAQYTVKRVRRAERRAARRAEHRRRYGPKGRCVVCGGRYPLNELNEEGLEFTYLVCNECCDDGSGEGEDEDEDGEKARCVVCLERYYVDDLRIEGHATEYYVCDDCWGDGIDAEDERDILRDLR